MGLAIGGAIYGLYRLCSGKKKEAPKEGAKPTAEVGQKEAPG
ncbi:MAG TPA: hypothetical protein VFF28_04040 [Candidatus Nanoarchaeia archaeon]|nr:hypothetical protein [Candidatus Nanoarchaeia archaeon]